MNEYNESDEILQNVIKETAAAIEQEIHLAPYSNLFARSNPVTCCTIGSIDEFAHHLVDAPSRRDTYAFGRRALIILLKRRCKTSASPYCAVGRPILLAFCFLVTHSCP